MQRQRARGLQHDLDPVVHERAALDHRAVSGPVRPSRARRERGAPDPEAGHGRQAQRHAHPVHFVLIRVVPGRVEPLVPRSPVEQLQRDRSTVRPREAERPVPLALARHPPGGRPYQDVAPKQRDIDHHHAASGPRRGIPQHERRRRVAGAFPGGVGVVPYQVEHGAAHDVTRQRLDAREPPGHGAGDIVARAPGDGIVELAADERAPCQLEQGTPVATSRAPRERGQRLGEALQAQLSGRSAPLERRARGVHALQRPGVAVRPAQLSVERRRLDAFPDELQELIEARHAERAARLELGQQVAQARHGRVRGVMVGAEEHGDVLRGRALHQDGPDRGPRLGEPVRRCRQRGPDLVPRGREVPHQHVPPVGAAPAVQVALLAGLAAQPPPHDAAPDPELARQRRPRRRMAEGVGRIQHVEPPAELVGVRGAQQQVANQRLAGGDQLVGEDVPGPHLQAPCFHQGLEIGLALGARVQVVGDEHGLAVEQEALVPRVGLEPLDQVVQRGQEARLKGGARQVPLAVPVGVRDEMEDEPAHWR